MLVEFKHKCLTGKPVMIHEDFASYISVFACLLEINNLKAYVTSSFRKDTNVKGAIVEPAKMSNHLVGYAIDVNLVDSKGSYWNSVALENPSPEILTFIEQVEADKMRWGGHFLKKDAVHFDYPLNVKNPTRWHEIYNDLHK